MVIDSDARDDTPFDDFEVEDERMADGRTIHYYVWPERAAADLDADAGADAGGEEHADV